MKPNIMSKIKNTIYNKSLIIKRLNPKVVRVPKRRTRNNRKNRHNNKYNNKRNNKRRKNNQRKSKIMDKAIKNYIKSHNFIKHQNPSNKN
jgi:hypothetical protein